MDGVVTLLADPAKADLDTGTVAVAARALIDAGGSPGQADWLAPGIAADLPFAGTSTATAQAAVDTALADLPIDVVTQGSGSSRRKRLLIADMDSTIVVGETLDEIATQAGIGEAVVAITARAMNGEIAFETALRERVRLLAGQPAQLLQQVAARMMPTPGAEALVRTMRHDGAHCLLISGGFTVFTDRVRDWLGFNAAEGNHLIVRDGVITGEVGDPIIGKERKLEALTETVAALNLTRDDVLAVGDGANDVPMLRAAGLGVAYHGKPVVRENASARIDHGDLTALLYLQGYRAPADVATA